MKYTDEDQFTLSVLSLQLVTGFSRTSLWRRLQNAPSIYRKVTRFECSPFGRAHKYYRLSDALIALRWAAKNKTALADAEKELVTIDARMRKQGVM